MKVSLWGSYNHGNFGDDVMAVVFAQHLQLRGHDVLVYRLDRRIANRYGIATTFNLDILAKHSNAMVIGGGAMWKNRQLLRSIVRPHARSIERDFKFLNEKANSRSIRIHAASIGSDGADGTAAMSTSRRRLFSSNCFRSATVRLPSDLLVAEGLGVSATYIPDVLLGISKRWTANRVLERAGDSIHVGINISKKSSELANRLISEVAKGVGGSRVKLHFLVSHLAGSGLKYEFVPEYLSPGVSIHHYDDPGNFLDILSSLDLVISSKLHLGVCASSYGAAFVSFGGQGKTRAHMKGAGLSEFIYGAADVERLLGVVSNQDRLEDLIGRYKAVDQSEAIEMSSLHFGMIDEFLVDCQ